MRRTNQSIKVRIVEEDYSVTGHTTKCRMRIRTQITPSWYHEYYAIGRAKCNPEDTYDESIGRKIAKARAVTKAYKDEKTAKSAISDRLNFVATCKITWEE